MMDTRQPVILHQKLGCGMDFRDTEQHAVYKTLSKTALAEAVRLENLSEEMRVLYVAMTRAKDKLILTGTVRDAEKALSHWLDIAESEQEAFEPFLLQKGKTYLDWVMPALLRHSEVKKQLEDLLPAEREELPVVFDSDNSRWTARCLTKTDIFAEQLLEKEKNQADLDYFEGMKFSLRNTPEQEEILSVMDWKYPYERETVLPLKLSISEIKRKHQEEMTGESEYIRKEIRFPEQEEQKGLSAAAVGIAMHTVMEAADFSKEYDGEALDGLVKELAELGRLTEQEAKALRRKELLTFFRSDLAARMRNNESVEKEHPFSLLMKPSELFKDESCRGIEDTILINGMIDCYFIEEDGVVLVDYKSDRVKREEEFRKRYEVQMRLYKEALERALHLPVKEVYIYSFALGKSISL